MQITQEKFNELFVIINGIECKQPQREPLEFGEKYFLVDPTNDNMYFSEFVWVDDPKDRKWLEDGLVYLNKEDAIKVATAFLMPLKHA